MADIAVVFHWGPEYLDGLELGELMDWREQAAKRAAPDD
ncbi:MAG: GpE family phage tail protein [Gammaproteobacteria bacterium]|nr:GpE family phage tail protein [Gammaproteobacteria bacterium]